MKREVVLCTLFELLAYMPTPMPFPYGRVMPVQSVLFDTVLCSILFFRLRPHSCLFLSPSTLSSVSFLSTRTNPSSQDPAFRVSALITSPKWDQNSLLKSLVSHMGPHEAYKVIQHHADDARLGVQFFKWVCKQSTYCYDIDSRISLLKLIVSSNLFGVAHKAIVELIKECAIAENDMLKVMDAVDGLRSTTGFRLNYPSYSSLLMGLAKLNMGFVAFLVYKRMMSDGFAVGSIDYKTLVNALCKSGLVEAGEMFLCRFLKLGFGLDTHICTSLVLGYCRENAVPEAFKVFDVMSQMDGCAPNSVTYTTLIHGLCAEGKLDEAFGLKEEMSEKGCLPSIRTYTVLIKAVCDIGLIDKALNFLDEMVVKGCKPNVYTYTVLIDGLCGQGKIEEANGLFRRMLKDGLFPGIVTYNALINGYSKKGRVVSAFEILSLMERKNCRPNLRTYNELMEGLCRINKSRSAMFLLRRMIDNGLSPDRVTFNVLIDGLCKEGQVDVASKIFNSMALFDIQPDGVSFTSIMDGLCKNGRPELANGLLGLMLKSGIQPDEIAFTALMDGYYNIGKTGDALMLCGWMMEHINLNSAHAFNLYIDILCKENRLKEEYAMLGKVLKYGLVASVVTYTILVNGLCRAGEITNALNMLELMKSAGCAPNVYTYTVVINGLCQSGRVQEAESFLVRMSDLGVPPNHITYTVLVKAHASAGRLDHALELLNTMVKNGCQPNNRTYSALLAGFALANKTTGAQASHSGENSCPCVSPSKGNDDEGTLSPVLTNIDVELASKIGDMIESYCGSATDFYGFLVLSLCREGRMDEAHKLTQAKVKHGLFPEKAVCSIIEWLCKEQRYDHCLDFMKLILNSGFIPSFACYCLLIHGLRTEGKSKQAQSLVFDLLKYNGVQERTALLPWLDFLVRDDASNMSDELFGHGREASASHLV